MKYAVILGDGMADYPLSELNGLTPLAVARIPYINELSKRGEIGLVKTVPEGMKAGSDVANLSVLGYDVKKGYTGRSPLEAANIGIELKETDVTVRANLVTLSNEEGFADKTMIDYSAGEITTEEARILIEGLAEIINGYGARLYAGISYRHCLVIPEGLGCERLVPPHDITGRPIKDYLPEGNDGEIYKMFMEISHKYLSEHPINKDRIKRGLNPANGIWLWGEGTKPSLQGFTERTSLKGAMISAVDLLNGIARLTGMEVVKVEGATGNYDTNFMGKAKACVEALTGGADFVYVHIEAADECGHHGDLKNKIYSIEQIDKVVRYVVEELKGAGESFKIMILPDHPTPLRIKTHTADPVPFLIYSSDSPSSNGASAFTEAEAVKSGSFIPSGVALMEKFLDRKLG